MKYVKGFDTLRALAVFYVIIEHWGPVFKEHTGADYIKNVFIQNGTFGVNLFFVLSGFLITSILLNEKFKDNGTKRLTIIKNFFVRRSLRIFPIYYLVILLCCLFGYQFVIDHIGYYATYTSNLLPYYSNQPNVLSHTWSLAVEEQFYLIWPWLIIFINKKYLKHVFIAAIIIGTVSKYIVLYRWHHLYPVLVINCFDSFGIGALYAYIRLNEVKKHQFEKGFRIVFPLLLFIGWKMAAAGISGLPAAVIYSRLLDSLIAIALIMFAINNKYEWMRKYVMENPVFNFIGKISYGIYLYHYTLGPAYDTWVADFVKSHPSAPGMLSNFYSNYCIKIALLITVCWLSFKLIEQPILRIKKRFEYTS